MCEAGSQKKTFDQCASIVEAPITCCHENLHVDIFAVVTDNEIKMEKMWYILKEKYVKFG